MTRPLSLFAAPHRIAFFTGTLGFATSVGWWLTVLAEQASGRTILAQGDIPAGFLHAPMLLLFGFSPFVFGFLMTVFPRWMGFPDLALARYGPVSALMLLAVCVAGVGLWTGKDGLLVGGLALLLAGWLAGLAALCEVLGRNYIEGKPICWHGWSALAALMLGFAALAATLVFILTGDGWAWQLGHQLAVGGFLLPAFLTVAHRMVPFFAGNVVADYTRWKPGWLLGALWLAVLMRLVGEIGAATGLAIAGNAALAALTGLMAWKWWPRAAAPGLLQVLIWGFAWAPVGFLLGALASAGIVSGLAPTHALLVGFSGNLLIAMVTRVTQGHSGRPLAMFPVAWAAFLAVQLATLVRLSAALSGEGHALLAGAAALLFFGTTPWLLRNAIVYLMPRKDGKPG